jgi:hypothetical protein
LDFFSCDITQLVDQGRIQGIRQGDTDRIAEIFHRHAAIHAGRGGRNGFQNRGVQLDGIQVDHFGAEMLGHDLELGIDVHQLKVLQNLADGFTAASLLLENLLQLQVINQTALFNQRQQWI